MNSGTSIEDLLRWRLSQAEAEAPPAPSAARLLELARPWWEAWPERFSALVERLGRIQVAYAHALAEPRDPRGGHSMPALIVRAEEEMEGSVRLLYLDVQNGRLRLRFHLDAALEPPEQAFEVTLVPEAAMGPPFSATAVLSLDREYRLDTELSEEIARHWQGFKVMHRIPYRWILRPGETAG